ncbi:response regulator transcription factor [Actinospica sp. MGRD01-02]|uniref:Response regulator transcription factor n=1 Tax=Actinospica acidithermotolerans TaxID=2828514 RepID=A0A941E874_9ACTN|nr:response regulator transcription factor [Actinospica acidithermotolerans]MBR7825708.1 response regulator transcription factor [Actinospica acidithermotolerans]
MQDAKSRVLVAIEDPAEVELLSAVLDLAGYRHLEAGSGAEAADLLARHSFGLVILDAGASDLVELGRRLRVLHAQRLPTLFLASRESLPVVAGELALSDADYVTRPLRIPEILTRAQVLLREPAGRGSPTRRYGDLVLDDAACLARRGQYVLDLTAAEYRLLRHLLINAERVVSKEQISRHVWGEVRGENAIEQLVSRLRRKVNRWEPALIRTRRGFGYSLGGPEAR